MNIYDMLKVDEYEPVVLTDDEKLEVSTLVSSLVSELLQNIADDAAKIKFLLNLHNRLPVIVHYVSENASNVARVDGYAVEPILKDVVSSAVDEIRARLEASGDEA